MRQEWLQRASTQKSERERCRCEGFVFAGGGRAARRAVLTCMLLCLLLARIKPARWRRRRGGEVEGLRAGKAGDMLADAMPAGRGRSACEVRPSVPWARSRPQGAESSTFGWEG
jgi:hypothetical protein